MIVAQAWVFYIGSYLYQQNHSRCVSNADNGQYGKGTQSNTKICVNTKYMKASVEKIDVRKV